MTMAKLGKLWPGSDSVRTYVRVELYFLANPIPEDKQSSILLNSTGASTYDRLSELLAPAAPSSKSVSEIFQLLQTHFEPKRVQIAERFNFRRRRQEAGKTIGEYGPALRKLAITAILASASRRNCATTWYAAFETKHCNDDHCPN